MKLSIFKKTIWILFYSLIFIFLIHNSYNYLDADLGWHLKVGEQIARERAVPSYDYYNHTLEGEKWVDHEWLLNFISFEIYDNFTYFGLTVFFALIVLITLLLLTFFTKNYFLDNNTKKKSLTIKQTILIMLFQLLGTMAMAPHLGVRMQEITLLYIILLLIFLFDFTTRKNYKILFFLIPLFYLWASSHAGFLIGLCLLFFYIGIRFCQNLISKLSYFKNFEFNHSLEYNNILILTGFGFLSIIATFFTPYGLKLYSFLKDYSNTFYMKLIAEWMPAYYMPIQYKQLLYLAILATILLLFLIDTYFKFKKNEKIKINLWLIIVSILFFALSFKSKRHFPLFFIVSFPLLILLAEKFLIYPPNYFDFLKRSKIVKFYLIQGIILASAGLIIYTNYTSSPFDNNHYCSVVPCGTIKFLQNNEQYRDKKIFNSYDWGGYIIQAYPDEKIFIDGRLPQYKFAGHTLLEEYLEFFKENKTKEKLDQYNIDLILYKKQPEAQLGWFEKYILMVKENEESKKRSKFNEYLNENKDWEKVYEDNISVIYSRK